MQARYRSANQIGFGEFSDSSYLLMAGVPEKPLKPAYIESDATSITVQLFESPSINGAPITQYKVMRDAGSHSSELATEVVTFEGFTS